MSEIEKDYSDVKIEFDVPEKTLIFERVLLCSGHILYSPSNTINLIFSMKKQLRDEVMSEVSDFLNESDGEFFYTNMETKNGIDKGLKKYTVEVSLYKIN